jgi:hypothetical protein
MVKILISKLYATQKELLPDKINNPTDSNSIKIEKIDNERFYIVNGHHRIAKEILEGDKESIEVNEDIIEPPFFVRLANETTELISFLEVIENFKKSHQKINGMWIKIS